MRGRGNLPSAAMHLLSGEAFFIKADEHGSRMAIGDRHAEALRRDGGLLCVDNLIALNVAPQLQRLAARTLLFLAADIGDDIVDESRAYGSKVLPAPEMA